MNTCVTSRKVTSPSRAEYCAASIAIDHRRRPRRPGRPLARQHAQQQHLGVRQAAVQFVQDRVDPQHGVIRRPVQMPQIVGADQHHRDFRCNAGQLAMVDPPQQAGGGVADEAQVHRVAVAVEALPYRSEIVPGRWPVLLPVLGDGIAQEDQLGGWRACSSRCLASKRSRHQCRSMRLIGIAARMVRACAAAPTVPSRPGEKQQANRAAHHGSMAKSAGCIARSHRPGAALLPVHAAG